MAAIARLFAAALALCAAPALAQPDLDPDPDPDLKPNRVHYELVAPKNPAHQDIHDRLARGGILDRLSKFLSPFRLPREVLMKVEGCDGDVNAYYDDAVITVCYEYLEYIHANAPKFPAEDGLRRRDAIIGPTVDVFLHEMGHAVFDLLEIPVFGREEDAADLFSAYIQLQVDREEAHALIVGIAFLGEKETREAMAQSVELKHHANVHGLPGQRYFNLLCVAYGFDPELFADAVSRWHLPAERAEDCDDEYEQLDHAFKTLIWPHLDQELLKEVRARKWLKSGPPR